MKIRIWLGPLLAVALLMAPAGVAAQAPMASLSVGSGSGLPGVTGVPIPVSLASQGGAQVVGLNFDLTFDSSRLTVASVIIGSAASSAGKSLSWSQPAANRIRVIIVGFNQDPIPDGPVATISFNVLGGAAPGTSSLTLSNTAASDPTGDPVPVNASSGSFEVLAPPATNTPTATATSTVTPTPTATATPGGPTDTQTPTPTRTLTPTPGGPTNTTAPTSTGATPTKTRTPTVTRTPAAGQTLTPAGVSTILPTGTLAAALTGTPGADGNPLTTQTAEAATAAAQFESAVAGTATALAEFDAAVKATATALARGATTPTPESWGITPRPSGAGLLLLAAVALALVALAAIFAFVILWRRA